MHLQGKNAVVYAAAGHMGGAVARAFAREGARVFLTGRTLETLDALAEEIRAAGGLAETGVVDAMDRDAVDAHASRVVEEAGSLDLSFNAVTVRAVQDLPLTEITLDDFMLPIVDAATTHFITATAAARNMVRQGSGVIILLSATSAKESRHEMGGFNVACAGVEALVRGLAGEVGRHGVRVVGIRPNFTPETADLADADVPQLVTDTLLGRLPRLAEVGGTAAYLASDAAGAITGVTLNLSCGAIID
ncbi:SDR family oxidoreductase [Glycomyces sp. TRM65418]|uniref:SDR family NAD(P)-dependent oxidoreductase n=1 Tax=Glycomyces sp. TRM65418 TaxID=2867006 RepID=UPI001CE55193|nr:SDR family oxidoreductase [Glycomyces sp. TRM65418]MCC3761501.1 SDR family oxidoreductase [Glycomyces sp. TRM65418]QZD55599.1 SDR family oxidoreductase [Glycomyces sp. TRM65418]